MLFNLRRQRRTADRRTLGVGESRLRAERALMIAGAIDEKPEHRLVDRSRCRHRIMSPPFLKSRRMSKCRRVLVLTFIIDQNHSDKHPLGKFPDCRLQARHCGTVDPSNDPKRTELVSNRDQLQKASCRFQSLWRWPWKKAACLAGCSRTFRMCRFTFAAVTPSWGQSSRGACRVFLQVTISHRLPNGSGRRELATWVASKENPLTARVIVNRVWQWHFGEGLVRTPSNFGKMGERPTHPELLDWLAQTFIDDGWSLKKLHQRIMRSATYQQASQVPRERYQQDPENRWLGRFSPRRIEAEAIRDAMLFVAGQLDSTPGGPADDDFTSSRRSLYVQTARWDRSSFAMLFDAANPDSSTEKRDVSIVAPQALLLLNHDFILTQARHLAKRLTEEVPIDDTARIQYAYQLLFGRLACEEELEIARKIVQSNGLDVEQRWIDLAHILLCSNEFVYLD